MPRQKRTAPAPNLRNLKQKQRKTAPEKLETSPAAEDAPNPTKTKGTGLPVSENDGSTSTNDATEKGDNNDDDEDDDEDDDYDPLKKTEIAEEESENSDDEAQPDYSGITTEVSQVRTRGQKFKENFALKTGHSLPNGLLHDDLRVDVDEIFQSLQKAGADDWALLVRSEDPEAEPPKEEIVPNNDENEEKVRIFTTYTFAGKLVREEKVVDANSAEAKAYLNSTTGLTLEENRPHKSYVTVLRKVVGTDEEKPLRIKLKRPSLIDKFLLGDKKNKLSTLEKSRLDWASFVDKKKLKDDLAIHNKGGYLEKQDFLGRVEAKRDTQYQEARELDRQRQWQQQQQQKL
ncbi:Bucentaur or craniofacial development [Metschnikowia aff. pulcherrima]|uniref:SWR1-complex protein 5 n=1 Tax=Metschnikowia aff. pulcherrima TaxID=2163413 RepID=A0A4V1AEP8_9ASCO|nr:Bucentaur or craniofacial development [Metschnikowia aff. pulcherrima]